MFKGLGTALITPFNLDGSIDFDAIERLVQHQLQEKAEILVVMGTTAEAATLSESDKRAILDHVIAINQGKAKIVYGIGGNNTHGVAESISQFKVSGVDGILSVSPYYNKPTQKGILEHYKVLNEATNLPIIVYNVPGRTASNISTETVLELAQLDNLVALKEASGNLNQVMDIIRNKPSDFTVLSGDDALNLAIMAAGGDGIISVLSNAYCKEAGSVINAVNNNDIQLARTLHYKTLTMVDLLFQEGNPAGIKEACSLLGICENVLRLPLVNVSKSLLGSIQVAHKQIRS